MLLILAGIKKYLCFEGLQELLEQRFPPLEEKNGCRKRISPTLKLIPFLSAF
jgi:hypothetical protein